MSPSVGRKRYGSPIVNDAVLAVVDLELVVERQLGAGAACPRRRRPGCTAMSSVRWPSAVMGAHGTRRGAERADHDAAVAVRMRAEERVGIGRAAGGELVGVGHVLCSNRSRGETPRVAPAPDRT